MASMFEEKGLILASAQAEITALLSIKTNINLKNLTLICSKELLATPSLFSVH